MFVGIYFQAFLKLVFLDFRPVFLSAEINSNYCEPDYGKPSGHMLTSTMILPIVVNIVFPQNSKTIRFLKLLLTMLVIFLIGLSRLYFGKHSINQLFLGVAFGLFIYCFLVHVVNRWMDDKMLKPILFSHLKIKEVIRETRIKGEVDEERVQEAKEDHDQEALRQMEGYDSRNILVKSREIDMRRSMGLFKGGMVIFCVSNFAMIMGFVMARVKVEFPESAFFTSFENCLNFKDRIDHDFSNKVIRDAGVFNVSFGLFLGNLLTVHRHLKALAQSSSVALPKSENVFQAIRIFYDRKPLYILARVFIFFVAFVPCFLPMLLGSYFEGTGGAVINAFLGLGLPLGCGFLIGFFYTKVLTKMGVPYYQVETPEVERLRNLSQ